MRARNMQALTDAIKRRYPGVVIYGVGDDAHRLHASDHNEDDTPGSLAAQSDADNVPEHRAIDVMIGPAFTKADGDRLVADLLADPDARKRLLNIIWYGSIWSRSWGWTRHVYTGSDQHTNHPHISGWAGDDENAADWPAVNSGGTLNMLCRLKDTGEVVKALQFGLRTLGFDPGPPDGIYGTATSTAVVEMGKYVGSGMPNGDDFNYVRYVQMQMAYGKKFGAGPGPAGKDGKDGVVTFPAQVVFTGTIKSA